MSALPMRSSPADARATVLQRLADAGRLDPAALARAELIAGRTRQSVEQVLNQIGSLSDEDLVEAYAEVTGLPVWSPSALPPEVPLAELEVSADYLRRSRILPLQADGAAILCASCDPLDEDIAAGLAFATDRKVELLIARPSDWRRAFDALDLERAPGSASLDQGRLEREIDQVVDLGASSAGSRIVASAFEAAIKLGASDIHFEPRRNDLRVRLRVDGQMVDHQTVSADAAVAAVSRVKVIANLDVGERRLPQDGRTSFVFGGRSIDVRVATSPTVFGESAVLRILDRSTVKLDLASLGLGSEHARRLQQAVRASHGMFLISGPTGSGKTTTLYALLQTFAGSTRKVLSVEDPVEYHFEHVTQTQVAPQVGLTFASALRSFLRQDPDVILVGEIRDAETAAVAVQAAMTGHLLLASVHANDAVSVVPRLIDMGVEPFQLAAGFKGAAAQRLVRRLCSACRRSRRPNEAERAFLRQADQPDCAEVFDAAGCPRCNGQGFGGRVAIAEVVMADEPFIRAIAAKAPTSELAEIAREAGSRPMAWDAADKIAHGLTTLEEAMAVLDG